MLTLVQRWRRANAAEILLALVLLCWGGFSVWPSTAGYVTQPAFAGMLAWFPAGAWGCAMIVAGAAIGWGAGPGPRVACLTGTLLAAPIWGAILVALWSPPSPPPGALLTLLYLGWTLWVGWRSARPPAWPA